MVNANSPVRGQATVYQQEQTQHPAFECHLHLLVPTQTSQLDQLDTFLRRATVSLPVAPAPAALTLLSCPEAAVHFVQTGDLFTFKEHYLLS